MRRRIWTSLIVPVAAFGLASPALAVGPVMPPSIPNTPANQWLYALWFSDTPQEWSPQGDVIADSGFRPEANGFPFPNFGGTYSPLNLFWNMPAGAVQPLTSATMRDLYGDGVCLTTQGTKPGGNCPLTPAAEYFAEYIFEAATGGHCYGFATTAASLYNGDIAPSEVGATTLMTQAQLTNATQQVITRNWAAQITTVASQQTPAEVVQRLIVDLTPGYTPYVMTIEGEVDGAFEGHAITPFAVYDRGNGMYDIAVYDNNYPGRQRAVHVDTVANTWEYLMQTNPSGQPGIMSGNATSMTMSLTLVDDIIKTQPCIVCQGGSRNNLATVDPTPLASGPLVLAILDLQGGLLPEDQYEVLPRLTPLNDEEGTYDAFSVAPRSGFAIGISGASLTAPVPVVVRDFSGESVKIASAANLPVGFSAEAVFDAAGVLAFGADVPSRPRLQHAFSEAARHYTSIAHGGSQVAAENARTMTVRKAADKILYADANSAGGSMTVVASLDRGRQSITYRAVSVAYPAGGHLVLDYSGWRRTDQRPIFGVDNDGNGTIDVRVPMKRVR